jgi:D-alanyl-D-alanine carboxypeptidase
MRVRVLLVALLLALYLPAGNDSFQAWFQSLERKGVIVSAGIWDLQTGKLISGHQVDQALIPASTTKVVSTYAMLKSWKPDFMLSTEIWGDLKNGVVMGDLTLKGGGDPFLTSERIWMLGQAVKGQGITRVTGTLRLDQSAFDDQLYGHGWENTSRDTTPPIVPLAVNFNRDESGRISRDPNRLAIETITKIWRESGLLIEGGPSQVGVQRKLVEFSSLPLRDLVQGINKHSNNFMVETLVKKFGEGSWPSGIKRIQGFYQNVLDLGPDKIQITDGSGLSKENNLSAKTLAIILRGAWNDFEVGPEFVNSLKTIGGEPWVQKFKDPNLARRVRCKTGHLNDVNTVCGYIQLPDGGLRVFAILLNGTSSMDDIWEQVSRWANP